MELRAPGPSVAIVPFKKWTTSSNISLSPLLLLLSHKISESYKIKMFKPHLEGCLWTRRWSGYLAQIRSSSPHSNP